MNFSYEEKFVLGNKKRGEKHRGKGDKRASFLERMRLQKERKRGLPERECQNNCLIHRGLGVRAGMKELSLRQEDEVVRTESFL